MSYIPPKEWERLLKRVFEIDTDKKLRTGIDKWGGTTQTGFDFEDHVPYIGAQRLEWKSASSGNISMGPGTTYVYVNVSGLGRLIDLPSHYSSGVSPVRAPHESLCDGKYESNARMPDVYFCNYFGFTSVGNYTFGSKFVRVWTWDTVNDVYDARHHYCPAFTPFRSTLVVRLRNLDGTLTATMRGSTYYALFSASKRIVIKLPQWIGARKLREKTAIPRYCPITVVRLGYFEIEEEHPYREYLADLPNRWDYEMSLKDLDAFKSHVAGRETPYDLAIIERGGIIRSATERVQQFVAEIYGPEDWSRKRILGKIKPVKVLYEEVL